MSILHSILSFTCLAIPAFGVSSPSPQSSHALDTGFLRGVNIGGWLLIEKWMNSDVFSGNGANAEDQWTFDSTTGAGQALQNHWKTYFTEADVETLKSYGINALRIPIGFWAYDNTGTPYISYGIGQGADNYLEQAIGWAQNAGLKVWVDCHGSPGSQNGFDNSGHMSDVEWQQGNNIAKSIAILTTMAKKYGSVQYSDTVIAIELVNEPTSSGANNFNTTQQFAREAYAAVKGNATSPDLMIVMHDAFVRHSTPINS